MSNSTVVCDRCGQEIADGFERYSAFLSGGGEEFDEICYHCASDLYDEGWEITDTYGFESFYKCCSCSEFFLEHELLVVDGGELECRDCGGDRDRLWDEEAAVEFWNTRPVEDALKAEVERLKEKLENVKKHLVIHRDHAIQSYRQDGEAYLAMNDFLVRFCNNLLEVINDDTEKG